MRHAALFASIALSLSALVVACATAPSDPVDESAQDQSATQPPEGEGAKLPPPSSQGADAGSSGDAGSRSDAGSSGSSSGSSGTSGASGSSGTSGASGSTSSSGGSTSSSGGAGAACDVSTTAKALFYQFELTQEANPAPCPCPTTKCCYLGVACLDP